MVLTEHFSQELNSELGHMRTGMSLIGVFVRVIFTSYLIDDRGGIH